jgi:hypothetical protein
MRTSFTIASVLVSAGLVLAQVRFVLLLYFFTSLWGYSQFRDAESAIVGCSEDLKRIVDAHGRQSERPSRPSDLPLCQPQLFTSVFHCFWYFLEYYLLRQIWGLSPTKDRCLLR